MRGSGEQTGQSGGRGTPSGPERTVPSHRRPGKPVSCLEPGLDIFKIAFPSSVLFCLKC